MIQKSLLLFGMKMVKGRHVLSMLGGQICYEDVIVKNNWQEYQPTKVVGYAKNG